jgi:predicted branched-subunit amino acid permease
VLVNLRFFVMSMTLAPMFGPVGRLRLALWAQFVSASSFLLTFFESRRSAPAAGDLFAYYRGVVVASFPGALIGTGIGITLAAGLSQTWIFGASLFLPVYFTLLLVSDIARRSELVAVIIALVCTPLMEVWLPGWGLFVVAMVAGALATRMGS